MRGPYTNTITWNFIDGVAAFVFGFFRTVKQEVIKSYYECDCEHNLLAQLLRSMNLPEIGVRHITYLAHGIFIIASILVVILLVDAVVGGIKYGIFADLGNWR